MSDNGPTALEDAIADARDKRPAMPADGRILLAEIDRQAAEIAALQSIAREFSSLCGLALALCPHEHEAVIARALAAVPAPVSPVSGGKHD